MPQNYMRIGYLLFVSLLLWSVALIVLNVVPMQGHLRYWLGEQKPLFLEVYCWAALGGTLAGYKFMADDKDRNELEALKKTPDPQELRYPDSTDVLSTVFVSSSAEFKVLLAV